MQMTIHFLYIIVLITNQAKSWNPKSAYDNTYIGDQSD